MLAEIEGRETSISVGQVRSFSKIQTNTLPTLEIVWIIILVYKDQLTELGINYAKVDPERKKAFDCATAGEVLGVWFDTTDMSSQLPYKKVVVLLSDMMEASYPGAKLSLHQVEVIHGKLNHFSQLVPPVKKLLGEVLKFLKNMLADHNSRDKTNRSRNKKFVEVPEPMKHDLKTCSAVIWHTTTHPLPILEIEYMLTVQAIRVYSDYSGHLLSNPSLGLYSPSTNEDPSLVCPLAFPRYFLLAVDEEGHKAYSKSTALEAIGFLVSLLIDPLRFVERMIEFTNDNVASVLVLKKGYSSGDPWAARVVAAGLGCHLQAVWEPRRSSRPTRIADNLTHNLLEELDEEEIVSYLNRGQVTFPAPLLEWMSSPQPDQRLGLQCLRWVRRMFPDLKKIRSYV